MTTPERADLPSVDELVERLELRQHPEGGFFREVFRDETQLPGDVLPPIFRGSRAVSTSIYYLLRPIDFSAFHRIASTEIWHHYLGLPLWVHTIDPSGNHEALPLGKDLERGQRPQQVVPAGRWFGARCEEVDGVESDSDATYALVGCTVAPGFDFSDFELARRSELVSLYPQHEELILGLTHSDDAAPKSG